VCFNNIGDLRLAQGNVADAAAAYGAGMKIREER